MTKRYKKFNIDVFSSKNVSNFFRNYFSDILTYIFAGLLIIDEIVESKTGFRFLKAENNDYRIIIGISLLVVFIINLTLKLNSIKEDLKRFNKKYLGVVEVLSPYEELNFAELLQKKKIIKILSLSGTISGQLGRTEIVELLRDENRKSKVTFLLADPFSPAIITRYLMDEPDSYEAGIVGIKRRLVNLNKLKQSLTKKAKNNFIVKVYSNYPTISVVLADNDLYSSVYGFHLRGGDCPKVHANIEGEYGVFLTKHFDKIYSKSINLEDWIETNKSQLTNFISE